MRNKEILKHLYDQRIEELTVSFQNSGMTEDAYKEACADAKLEYEEILIDFEDEQLI